MNKIFILIPILSTFILSRAQAQYNQNDNPLVKEFDSYFSFVKNLQVKQPINCNLSSNKICSFKQYCSSVDLNRDKHALYENAQGQKIDNVARLQLFQYIGICPKKELFPAFAETAPLAMSGNLYNLKLKTKETSMLAKNALVEIRNNEPRIKKLFEQAQTSTIEFLKNRIPKISDSDLRDLENRLKSVKFEKVNFKSEIQEQICSSPNAANLIEANSITICPQMYNLPDSAILSTLIHEFAHSIDICRLSVTTHTSSDAKKYDFKTYDIDQSPFKETLSCLGSGDSTNLELPNLQDLKDFYKDELAAEGFNNDEKKEFDQDLEDAINNEIEKLGENESEALACSPQGSKANEHFADWISSTIMNQTIAKLPTQEQRKQASFEAFGFFLASACETSESKTEELFYNDMRQFPALSSCLKEIMDIHKQQVALKNSNLQSKNLDTHPNSAVRFERNFLAQPNIRNALGCENEKPAPRLCP